MDIENKWKRYSIDYHFSDYEEDSLVIYNALHDAEDADEINAVLVRYEVVVWEQFENYSPIALADAIAILAGTLQMVAAGTIYPD